jgi:hypothetical protein
MFLAFQSDVVALSLIHVSNRPLIEIAGNVHLSGTHFEQDLIF